jgi:hypothetical protein
MVAVPPNAGLIVDDSGNLYGTTIEGGGDRDYNETVFRLDTIRGMFTVLFKLGGARAPTRMQAWFEIQRDLYGTTVGAHSNGVMFQLLGFFSDH